MAIELFCERCGSRQASATDRADRSGGALARRLMSAVGWPTADGARAAHDEFLRLCLECRGYSCPACWNTAAGVCRTCAPLPEPMAVAQPPASVAQPPTGGVVQPFADQPADSSRPNVVAAEMPTLQADPILERLALYTSAQNAPPEPVAAADAPAAVQVAATEPKLEHEPEHEYVAVPPEPQPEPRSAPLAVEAAREPKPVAGETERDAESVAVERAAAVERGPAHIAPPLPARDPTPVAPREEVERPLPPAAPPAGATRPLQPPVMASHAAPPRRASIAFVTPPRAYEIHRADEPYQPYALARATAAARADSEPTARTCSTCRLTVSAKARFCRRCGTPQS